MVGTGFENRLLTEDEIVDVVARGLSRPDLDGKRVLMIIPDHTRTAPIPLIFKSVYKELAGRVKSLDVLIALGTHQPMAMDHIYRHVGITPEEHDRQYSKTRFFNHQWDDPGALQVIQTISEEKISEISEGRLRASAPITINKMALDYDHLLLAGPVMPQEAVGYSGGNKYIIPGIAGEEIINLFHWLAALITCPKVIGNRHCPVRKIIDTAASYVPVERSAICMVVKGEEGLAGIYYGTPEEAWSSAVDLSSNVNIVYVNKPFETVFTHSLPIFDDLWTGGKCVYKHEPVVADGGKLIIYAPHISEISYTHGKLIGEIGYHIRDYFVKQWDRFKHYPWGILAHSCNVRGIGTFEDGVEKFRMHVYLSSRIPEEQCRKVGLGYIDPDSIRIKDYQGRQDEGILFVPNAGETLYQVRAVEPAEGKTN